MGQCWFCEKHPQSEKANIRIPLHYVLDRKSGGLPPALIVRQVTYKKERKMVVIPRCDLCKKTMSGEGARNFLVGLAAIGGGILIGMGSNAIIPLNSILPGIFLGIIGGIACAVPVVILQQKIAPHQKEMIHTDRMEFPELKRLLDEGWRGGEKPVP